MNKNGKMITANEAKPTKKQHTSPCSDCPWRRDSVKGWLGEMSAQEWRDLLLTDAADYYQTFAGARGFFRLPRHVYDAILANVTPMAAE